MHDRQSRSPRLLRRLIPAGHAGPVTDREQLVAALDEAVPAALAGGAVPRRARLVTTVGFLHTADVHVAAFTELLAAADPTASGRHLVDESLLADARAAGVDEILRDRILARLRELAPHVDAVLCTCSTISGAAESLADDAGVRVVRIDRPMAEAAVRAGRRIGVVAAVETTLAPTLALLREEAEAAGVDVDLIELPCLDAWAHFEAGDIDAFLSSVAQHVDAVASGVDVIVLAQASMAAAATSCATDRPVLTSPRMGIDAVLGGS